jgi:hypothetical protein
MPQNKPTSANRAAALVALEAIPLESALALAPFLPARMRVKMRNRIIRHVLDTGYPGMSATRAARLLTEAIRHGTADNPLVAGFIERIQALGLGPVGPRTVYNTILA